MTLHAKSFCEFARPPRDVLTGRTTPPKIVDHNRLSALVDHSGISPLVDRSALSPRKLEATPPASRFLLASKRNIFGFGPPKTKMRSRALLTF
jgi:hypothetical protein